MTFLVEMDGTDTTGKTTVSGRVCASLKAFGQRAAVVPSASELVDGFDRRFEEASAAELVDLEVAGYRARRRWAAGYDGEVAFIDRGLRTLVASSKARLLRSEGNHAQAAATVEQVLCNSERSPDRRYLLSYRKLSLDSAVEIFREREPAPIGDAYLAYQETFLKLMRKQPVERWDAVFSATQSLDLTCTRVAADIAMIFGEGN